MECFHLSPYFYIFIFVKIALYPYHHFIFVKVTMYPHRHFILVKIAMYPYHRKHVQQNHISV